MDNKSEKIEFSEKEERMITIAALLVPIVMLFNGVLSLLMNTFDKIGKIYLYSCIADFCLLVISIIWYLVLFITDLRKIKPYRLKYSVIAVILALLLAMHFYWVKDFIVDVFTGSKTVISSEYSVYGNDKLVIYDGNEEIKLEIPEEIAAQLHDKSLSSETSLSDNYLINHSSSITVEYYPNSKVFLNVNLTE